MWLTKSLVPIIAINIVVYLLLKKYFGYVRSSLYWLIVVVSIIMGYIVDMLGMSAGSYAVPITVGVFFALFVAMCVYEYLFTKQGK